jgi:CRISPR-associated protein Csd1
MFVQALAAYADEKLKDELNDVAFEERPVPYYLSLAADGRFLAVIPRFIQVMPDGGKGKPKQRSQTHRVPRSPVNRNSGLHPMLAADDIGYVLGPGTWTKPNDIDKVTKQHEAFIALIHRVSVETQDEAMLACSRFYSNLDELQRARADFAGRDAAPGSTITFYFSPTGEPVTDREPVQMWWRRHYDAATQERASTETAECLISGIVGPIPSTHPKIKHTAALGGQPSGVSLMSFDKGAFRSYGWEQNANSPVSADRAMAYVLALNALLKPGSPNRRDFGDVAFLFWLRKDSPLLNPAEMLEEAPDAQRIEAVQRVIELNRHAWIEEDNRFYMAAVSANGSRLILRSWITELLPVAAENVLAWWNGVQMQPFSPNEPLHTPHFWQLHYAIEREGKPSARRIVDLRRRALLGRRAPLGREFITEVLQRMKVDSAKRTDLAALGLLRLCLNDFNYATGEKEMPPSLDPQKPDPHPAYICGRLLAVHDYLQWKTFDAAGESQPNSTVADRFYNLVMNSPAVGMEKVFTLGRKHIAKLRKLREAGASAAFGVEQQIGQLELQLSGDIPPRFGMHDKARFALGFYHQKAFRPQKGGGSENAGDNDTTFKDFTEGITTEKESD